MNRSMRTLIVVTCVLFVSPLLKAQGQSSARGTVIVPDSSVEHPGDRGVRSHTNFLIFVPAARKGGTQPFLGGTSPGGETPASLSCVYQTWAGQVSGCPINGSYNTPSGGTNVIAIVDAYDYPTAANDFQVFSQTFHLPYGNSCGTGHNAPCFTVTYASGSQPRSNCGWAQEAALDIEWSHAMAPQAQIILVEAASNSFANLMQAVQVARDAVAAAAGGGEVSMSWGGSESSTQSTYDTYFTGANVAYFASSGDTGGKVIWPSASPDVLSAGGTSVNRDSSGNFTYESAWSDAGGGPSKYEPIPSYQSGIYPLSQLLGNYRGTPDLSFDADPYTGVSVYDSTSCQGLSGWLVFGGTSVSAPSLAGIANFSGNFSGNNGVQDALYQNYSSVSGSGISSPYSGDFYDVISGSAGSYPAGNDWDFASGIGTVRGLTGFGGAAPSASFSVSASPSKATITEGQNTSFSITVTPSNGYTGTVDLGVTGCPTNATCSLPSSVGITGTSSQSVTLNISATSSTVAGTYTLTVTGTDSADSNLTSSASVSVTVNPASSGGDFSISASPGNVTLKGGGLATYTVSVSALNGYTGTVNLSATSNLSGATYSFNPAQVANGSGSSTLTVNTGSSPQKGNYTVTIVGTDSSTPTLTHSTTVGLKIH